MTPPPTTRPLTTRPLTISFFGSSLVSAFWNGAATYYRGVIRALAARGHRVTFYEPDAYERQRHRDMDDPDWCRVVVYAPTAADLDRCLDEGARADLVVKASGVGVLDRELEAGVLAHRRPGSLVAFWDVDAPATLERVHGDARDPFRALVPRYDVVFTYGGGPPVVRAYEALGARLCAPIYNALDPSTHHPSPPRPEWAADLALLANRLPDRERRVDEFFLRAAALAPDRAFLLGGAGWADKPLPVNVRAVGHVYTRDHNAFNSSARAVLNVARDSMARTGWSPATRVFEAAGAGACLITDAWEGLDDFLAPGREVLVARDGEEVARHLRDLTNADAAAIGAAARARVLLEHTYDHRAREVERVLERGEARRWSA
ncbi:MAG: glycosyltransferase [Planctomycetota bacterium]|nr:glycosyltransferase [Planctomycetota bacterium]